MRYKVLMTLGERRSIALSVFVHFNVFVISRYILYNLQIPPRSSNAPLFKVVYHKYRKMYKFVYFLVFSMNDVFRDHGVYMYVVYI